MKNNDDKIIETVGIDYQGFLQHANLKQMQDLMEWSFSRGFKRGLLGGIFIAFVIYLIIF